MSRQLICCFMACLPKRSAFYALFAQAFITSVRLLCEREVPLTHRLPAICLLEMHREKESLSLSLRGVTFFASDVRIGWWSQPVDATLYLRKKDGVLGWNRDFVEGLRLPRRRNYGTAGSVESL